MKKSIAAKLAVFVGALSLCVYSVAVAADSSEYLFSTVTIAEPDPIRDALPEETGYPIVRLNFRNAPCLDGKVLCTLEQNEEVHILERAKDYWVKTDKGYCYGPYLASEAVDTAVCVSFEGEKTADYMGVFYRELEWLPEEYLDSIRNFRFVVTDKDLTDYYDGPDVGEMAGLTTAELPDGDHVIYLKREKIGDILLHEVWHAVEFNEQYHSGENEVFPYSQSPEYMELYERYKDEYLQAYNFDYAASSSREFWAQVFFDYIKRQELMKKKTPELYQAVVREGIFELS